jgi:hypothetical protein
MTRGIEALLRRVLMSVSLCLIGAAVALAVKTFIVPSAAPHVPALTIAADAKKAVVEPADPRIVKLLSSKMNKTIVPKIEVVQKPAAPALSSLLRVKGILDFGDPKTAEAIIEILRGNQIKTFKVNETIAEVGATITLIDTGVTFNYDGKSVRMTVNSGESADAAPTAGGGADGLSDGSTRSAP